MAKKASKTYVSFLLDESGSMQGIKDDTVGGYNSYVSTLKKIGDVSFSFIKFDSNGIRKIHVAESIENVPDLNDDTYQPNGMTPLIDACVKTIQATERATEGKKKCKVIVVFQTDGAENCSREYNATYLSNLVSEKKEAGWEFVFLGAGIDSYSVANTMGISTANTMAYARGASGSAFEAVSTSSMNYLSGNSTSMGFTDMQKKAAGDVFNDYSKPVTEQK